MTGINDDIHRISRVTFVALQRTEHSPDWSERYRPTTVQDMALSDSLRNSIAPLLAQPRLVHDLVLAGPPATGKTTLTTVMLHTFFRPEDWPHRVRLINAPSTGGVNMIRDELLPWMRMDTRLTLRAIPDWWALVVISEADALTADAQRALNDAMEQFKPTFMFILTTNNLDGLIPSIQSRCTRVEFTPPPLEERVRVLARILQAERAEVPVNKIRHFACHYEDMRHLVKSAQASIQAHGRLRPPDLPAWEDAWPEPRDGAELLDDLAAAFSRYLALPRWGAETLALWVVFAHAHQAFAYSPILALVSPTMRSGKTRVLEVLAQLTPSARHTSNTTPAVIFRRGAILEDNAPPRPTVPARPPLTLLLDEGDTWLRLRPEAFGILNSGHTRGGAVERVVRGEVVRFSTFFPKAIAFIERSGAGLPATVLDRSIVMPMRRARKDEQRAEWRAGEQVEELLALRRQVMRWALDHFFELLLGVDVQLPDQLDDRAKDKWRPLSAISQLAGGRWPEVARSASLALSGHESEELVVTLLSDIREAFITDPARPEVMTSMVLVAKLGEIEDRPWRGSLTPWRLAQMLRPFGIVPKPLWTAPERGRKRTLQGYSLREFDEAFSRFLGPRGAGQGR